MNDCDGRLCREQGRNIMRIKTDDRYMRRIFITALAVMLVISTVFSGVSFADDEKTEGESAEESQGKAGFVWDNGEIYFVDEDGNRAKNGWIEFEDAKYYASKTGAIYRNRYINFGSDRYFMLEDGRAARGFFWYSGELRYADLETCLVKEDGGWITYADKKFFARDDGVFYHDRAINFDGVTYYLGADGGAESGFFEVDGDLRYFNPSTYVANTGSGWLELDGKRYYAEEGGVYYHGEFAEIDGSRYYFDETGAVCTGFFEIDGTLYCSNENTGSIDMTNGWLNIYGRSYYTDAEGKLYRNTFIHFGDVYYYMGDDGSVQTGWFKSEDGKLHYADPETGVARAQAGWFELDGKRYYNDGEGNFYFDQIISLGDERFFLDEDGSVKTGFVWDGDKLMYAEDNGLLRREAGWKLVKGKLYYSNDKGEFYYDRFIHLGEDYYYMGADGAAWTDRTDTINGIIYSFDERGVVTKEGGWGEFEGKRYFKNEDTGTPYTNTFLSFGDIKYYAGADGYLVSGWQTINGKRYYFDPDSYEMVRDAYIDGQYIDKDGVAKNVEEIKVVSSSTVKTYMSYTAVTNTASLQYQILSQAEHASNGLMYYDGYICIALGSQYGPVGTKYYMTIGGTVYKFIKADAKADIHTANGAGWTGMDGHIIECIVDMDKLDSRAAFSGNCNVLIPGSITKILRIIE